jgi:membrane fusion protein (multidrug efflux system)
MEFMKTPRKPARPEAFAGVVLTLLTTALMMSCGDSKGGKEGTASGAPEGRAAQVTVQTVSPSPFTETLELTGYIKATDDVTVSTEEGAVLKEGLAARGTYVKKGDVIARLNDDVLRPQYEAAQAQYQIAELNFQKQQKVFEEAGISEIQAKTSEYTRDAAKAQADLMKARLERMRVKSPVNGILDDRLVDEGELAPPGVAVARIVNLDRIKVLINAPENYAGTLTRGSQVSVRVSAYPGETFAGKISFVGAAVIPDNRTVPVEVVLSNPGRKLKPDMIARATVTQPVQRKVILVDEGVIQMVDQKTHVVYVEEDGKARRRTVTIGGRNDGRVEVLSGLKVGDHLIISGYQNVFDGQKVDISNTSGT